MNKWPALFCLLTLHSPDGSPLYVLDAERAPIPVKLIAAKHHDHIASKTSSVIYVEGQSFGVIETPARIISLIHECDK